MDKGTAPGYSTRIDVTAILTGVSYALAAIACAAATWETLSNHDAIAPAVAVDLLTILSFVLSAFVARSLPGAVIAILIVPFSLFDAFVRLLAASIGTDSPKPISALTFYGSDSSSFYPFLGFLLIVGMGFALRRRARLAWIGSFLVAAIAGILCILQRDPSMLAGVWYIIAAVDLIRPRRVPVAALIVALILLPTSGTYAYATGNPWIGDWTARTGENQQSLTITLRGGKLHISGVAVWYDRTNAAHDLIPSGYFTTIVAPPNSDRLSLSPGDMPGCIVHLRLLGRRLIAHDNKLCGGMNVTFTGAYRRK